MWDNFYKEIYLRLVESYPALDQVDASSNIRNIISPFKLQLNKSTIDRIKTVVAELFAASRCDDYRKQLNLSADEQEVLDGPSRNLSVLMGYDFHLNGDELKLIEINTNSSGFPICDTLYSMHDQSNPFANSMESLRKTFISELEATGVNKPHIAIIDEKPSEQKMFLEFLIYKDLFKIWGYEAEICDHQELKYYNGGLFLGEQKIDFVYNRYCDFTLTDPTSLQLRQAYLDGSCVFSPNPKEYVLLADKKRLSDLEKVDLEEMYSDVLLHSRHAEDFDSHDEIWKQRKKLFFKPSQSYGGKAAFRGSSISRKAFERALSENSLIQDYAPAEKVSFAEDESGAEWKYDLRAYAYGGKVQMLVGRLYQGQVTNFSTPFGGFCPVFFA